MELHTPRLLIREFAPDDQADVHAYASQEQTVRYMDWGPNTFEQTQEFMQRKMARQRELPRGEYELAVVLKEINRVIGGVGLRISRPEHFAGDMGYVFDPQYWG